MMIEISDDYGDGEAVTIDTYTADRETLAEALIKLHKQWDWLDKAWDKRAETPGGNGLDFRDTQKGAYLDVIDPAKAFAWLQKAHAECVAEQIAARRQAKIEELEDSDD